jgi:hypothetical protein
LGTTQGGQTSLIDFATNKTIKKISVNESNWNGVTTLFLAEYIDGFCQFHLQDEESQKKFEDGAIVHLACPPIKSVDILDHIEKIYNVKKEHFPSILPYNNYCLEPNSAVAPPIEEQLELLKNWSINNL